MTALKKIEKGAVSPELKAAFEKHRGEIEVHVNDLQQVFKIIVKRAQGKTCEAIEGIIAEAKKFWRISRGNQHLTPASAAQAVEHYEIARYSMLARWAKELGCSGAHNIWQPRWRRK